MNLAISLSRSIQNTIANFIGVASTMVFAFIFSIAYFRILGSENYVCAAVE
jgi:hypothetical protein